MRIVALSISSHEQTQSSLLFSGVVSCLYFYIFRGHKSCRCFCVEFVKFSLCIDILVLFFQIRVLGEYWVLKESRIPLKLVLKSVRNVTLGSVFPDYLSQYGHMLFPMKLHYDIEHF